MHRERNYVFAIASTFVGFLAAAPVHAGTGTYGKINQSDWQQERNPDRNRSEHALERNHAPVLEEQLLYGL